MKLSADIIKTAVLSYYRFRRQMLCVDEAYCNNGRSDVLVESDKGFYDIEIKISKSDLWQGEARKRKHYNRRNTYLNATYLNATYFIMCVPESLLEEAKKWVDQTNSKYGILVFKEDKWNKMCELNNIYELESLVKTIRTPKKLTEHRSTKLHDVIVKRLTSAYITKRQKDLKEKIKLDK